VLCENSQKNNSPSAKMQRGLFAQNKFFYTSEHFIWETTSKHFICTQSEYNKK